MRTTGRLRDEATARRTWIRQNEGLPGATRCAHRCPETGLGALGRAAGRGPPGMFGASLGGELGPSASDAGAGALTFTSSVELGNVSV